MSGPKTERHLAAILAADMVGYSRAVATDEAGTLTGLRRLRAEGAALRQHVGRPGAGVFRRRGCGGDHRHPFAHPLLLRHRAQLGRRLQGPGQECPRDRTRAGGRLCARGQRAGALFARALEERPNASWIHRNHAPALHGAGRIEEARASAAALKAAYPGITARAFREAMVFSPRVLARVSAQLRALGLPESCGPLSPCGSRAWTPRWRVPRRSWSRRCPRRGASSCSARPCRAACTG